MAEIGFFPEDKWATYLLNTMQQWPQFFYSCNSVLHTQKLFYFSCKSIITASYITDGEIMHVEGASVTSGFATNMCQHEHQRAVL